MRSRVDGNRAAAARRRALVVQALLALLLVAQQIGLVCCLPCVLADGAGGLPQAARGTDADAGDAHQAHAGARPCETCGACVPLLAAAPPSALRVERAVGDSIAPDGSRAPHVVVTVVPFASRAPPAAG